MMSQGILGDVGATVLQLLSIVPLSRLIQTADRAIAIAFDVRNYESYQDRTLEEIKRLTRPAEATTMAAEGAPTQTAPAQYDKE